MKQYGTPMWIAEVTGWAAVATFAPLAPAHAAKPTTVPDAVRSIFRP